MAGFFSRENRWNNKLTVLVWISLSSVHTSWATDETTVVNGKPTKCGIYLAPSSIPGAGLGMYAGDVTFVPGDRVTLGDIVIPISEYHWNNKVGPFADDVWTPDEYTWNSPVFPYMDDEGRDSDLIMGMSPGVGAAANSYLTLVNIEYGDTETDRPVPPQSPGTGANTPYYAREYHATKTIPPGGEIFVEYVVAAGGRRERRQIMELNPSFCAFFSVMALGISDRVHKFMGTCRCLIRFDRPMRC
jgi:hypothetical protein